jgi:hypothetical protein
MTLHTLRMQPAVPSRKAQPGVSPFSAGDTLTEQYVSGEDWGAPRPRGPAASIQNDSPILFGYNGLHCLTGPERAADA